MTTKTKQRKPTLPTTDPAWLEAKVDTDNARSRLTAAKRYVAVVIQANEAHAAEIVKIERNRDNYPLITNGTALTYGTGSGYNVVHFRCRCEEACDHDPAESPYSPEAVTAADRAIIDAEAALSKATANLEATDAEYDAFAHAREAGATYVWWPQSGHVDPRLRVWQGRPLTAEDVDSLGPHKLNRALVDGSVIEVG